jgi:hypothetical protein
MFLHYGFASMYALEHGVSYSCVGSSINLFKNCLRPLDRVVDHVLVPGSHSGA